MAGGQALPGVQGLQLPASARWRHGPGPGRGQQWGLRLEHGRGWRGGLDAPAAPCRPAKKRRWWPWGLAALSAVPTSAVFTDTAQACIPRQKNLEFDISLSCARGIIPRVSRCELLSSLPITTLTVRHSCCCVQLRHGLHVVMHVKKRLTTYLSILLLTVIGCFQGWLL